MKYFKLGNLLALVVSTAMFVSACKKTETPAPLNGAGSTFVKILDGGPETAPGYKIVALTASSIPVTIEMIDVRRDLPNNSELNKAMTVSISDNPGAVTDYGAAQTPPAALLPMPTGSYSVVAPATMVGSTYFVPFAAGEFAKTLKLSINTSLLDLTKRYAMGFTVSAVDGGGKIASGQTTYIVEIGVKNQLDGIWQLKGYVLRNVPPIDVASTGWVGPKEISLVTTGPNSVRYLQSHGWANTATIGMSGTVSNPTYTVDPATNLITITSDGGPFPAGLGNLPGYISKYVPPTGTTPATIYAYATWSGGAGIREMHDTLVYLRPR